jgi:hypothetical protein
MQTKRIRWMLSGMYLLLLVRIGTPQTPTLMTREQAGQIILQFAQVGQYPGVLHWLTTDTLPAKMEVPEWDMDLISYLASQGGNWNATMGHWQASWFGTGMIYGDVYYFLVTFDQYPERYRIAKVNAWTGYCELEPFRGYRGDEYETNENLGLGNYPVKTFDELRNIAVNIARQLLGDGTLEVLTVPYSPDKYQVLADMGWGFIVFKVDPKTGAHLPQMVELWINSRTGWLEKGALWKRTVTVSTMPLISKEEAKRLARRYLADLGITITEWFEDGFYGGEIINKVALPYYAVVGLYVYEDELLEQHLVWSLIGTSKRDDGRLSCEWVMVDALTGTVKFFGEQGLNLSLKLINKQVSRKVQRLELFRLSINGKLVDVWEPILCVNGRTFICADYCDNLGVEWVGDRLKGRCGEVRVGKWDTMQHHGRLYLPLRRICEVTGIRLWWDNERKVPILKVDWLDAKRMLEQRR